MLFTKVIDKKPYGYHCGKVLLKIVLCINTERELITNAMY